MVAHDLGEQGVEAGLGVLEVATEVGRGSFTELPVGARGVAARGEVEGEGVAWGELGLDRFHREPALDRQRAALDDHLECIVAWTAAGCAKPVIIHCRDAFDDLLPVLQASGLPPQRFVFHCFTAGPREMELVLAFGASVSFTGVATYRNAPALREAIAMVPLDRIMVETDAPFLSPEPVRAVRPCEPAFVVHTARAIAAQRGLPYDEFERLVDRNARAFLGLPLPGGPARTS